MKERKKKDLAFEQSIKIANSLDTAGNQNKQKKTKKKTKSHSDVLPFTKYATLTHKSLCVCVFFLFYVDFISSMGVHLVFCVVSIKIHSLDWHEGVERVSTNFPIR
jgi:hypothetical protein